MAALGKLHRTPHVESRHSVSRRSSKAHGSISRSPGVRGERRLQPNCWRTLKDRARAIVGVPLQIGAGDAEWSWSSWTASEWRRTVHRIRICALFHPPAERNASDCCAGGSGTALGETPEVAAGAATAIAPVPCVTSAFSFSLPRLPIVIRRVAPSALLSVR